MENRDTIHDLDLDCPWSSAGDEPDLDPSDRVWPVVGLPVVMLAFVHLVLEAMLLLGEALGRALHVVLIWPLALLDARQERRARERERRMFAQMSDSMLKDIGLTRCDLYDDLYERCRRRKR